MITIDYVNTEANKADVNASQAKREAGNYMKGHISVRGMKIAIENPKGSRRYYGEDGDYVVMNNHYGYFNVTKGKDGDAVDVFLGPDIEDFENVYCIDQNNKDGEFDETKVMLGFKSKEQAKRAYLSNYSKGWKGFRDITAVSLRVFKRWLYRGRKQRQPFADYAYIQRRKLDESYGRHSTDDILQEIYYEAVSFIKRCGFKGNRDEISDAVEAAEGRLSGRLRGSVEDCARTVGIEAMKMLDRSFYEEEIQPLMLEKKIVKLTEGDLHFMVESAVRKYVKENKLTRDDDFSYPRVGDEDADFDAQYEKWASEHQPTQEDWDDYGFWKSSDEPDLWQDEMDEDYQGLLIDSDDAGEGYTTDYMNGVAYARSLIAKNRVPDGLVEQLEDMEDHGKINAFQLGMLDMLCEV